MNNKNLSFPNLPGIYFFKDQYHTIIYIGKAKNLRKRIASYFHQQKKDWKVAQLIAEHSYITYIVTHNEQEALLLEAQLIKDYKPKFNVLLKSSDPFVYLVFTDSTPEKASEFLVSRHKPKQGRFFGPFLYKKNALAVHTYLTKTFHLMLCNKKIENGCLDYHIGLCAGSCLKNFNLDDYMVRLELAHDVLQGKNEQFITRIHQQITTYNNTLEFEKAAHLNAYIKKFDIIFSTINTKFNRTKYQQEIELNATAPSLSDSSADQALIMLQNLLNLPSKPITIDCFDISHFQSTHIVGSCIRFTNGKKDPNFFRRFKVRSLKQQNDYAALQEIVVRRYKKTQDFPDIIFIDGGKGQRNAIAPFVPKPCISLAKKEELLITEHHPDGIKLDLQNPLGKLLIALRDYAHHFAISYHRSRRSSQHLK